MHSFDTHELLLKYRYVVLLFLLGAVLLIGGIFLFRSGILTPPTKVEVLGGADKSDNLKNITVEISGGVINPGVYQMVENSRVDDLLVMSGGFSATADRVWTDKNLNRAAKLIDAQKVYIPIVDQQSKIVTAKDGGVYQTISTPFLIKNDKQININSCSLQDLDSLPGIGQVYGQNIIEHRPYSEVGQLLSKGVLKLNVFNKIKDMVTVY